MYVIILGAGKVGVSLARWLVRAEHEVTVIDRDGSECSILDDELGGISVVGDGTEPGVLAKAGASRADVFIATTGQDGDNLVACQLVKHVFLAAQTVSLVSIAEHEALFSLLGVDFIVNTTDLTVMSVKDQLRESVLEEA